MKWPTNHALPFELHQLGILSFLCSSQIYWRMIKRVYFHEEIYDTFLQKLVDLVKTLKVGAGTESDVFVGPVQNKMQFEKARGLCSSIATDKLEAALGGTIEESSRYLINPTIIENLPESSRVVQEEPFAPILPLMKWSDEADVIAHAKADDTRLASSIQEIVTRQPLALVREHDHDKAVNKMPTHWIK